MGQIEESFAAPDAHDSNVAGIAPVDDAERRMNQLPQKRLSEFRDHPPHIGILTEALDPLNDLRHKPAPDLRSAPLPIPCLQLLEIT